MVRRNPALLAGVIGLSLLVFLGLLGPVLAPRDPLETHTMITTAEGRRILPPFPPSAEMPLGSDSAGRDILSGMLSGAKFTLSFTALSAVLSLMVAVPVGILASIGGRYLRTTVEAVAAGSGAIPPLLSAGILLIWIRLVGTDWSIMTQAVITSTGLAILNGLRLSAMTLLLTDQIRVEPFVEAAVAAGATKGRIVAKHILPNLMAPIVTAALLEGAALLRMQALLGVFSIYLAPSRTVQLAANVVRIIPVIPDWSSYMGFPFGSLRTSYWTLLFPGLAIATTVLVLQLLASGLQHRSKTRG